MSKPTVKIWFNNDQEMIPLTYKMKMLVRRAIEETLTYEQFGNPCEVSVTFTDNQKIHELNRQYREVDAPTDVLSFPLTDYDQDLGEPCVDEPVSGLGDIVLSLEKAREQGEEFGHGMEREMAFLCVHSMLHLLGYDHETGEEDELDMRARQTAIVENMGLGVKEEKA